MQMETLQQQLILFSIFSIAQFAIFRLKYARKYHLKMKMDAHDVSGGIRELFFQLEVGGGESLLCNPSSFLSLFQMPMLQIQLERIAAH